MTTRRGFLTGLGAVICAPAIVRASSLMPIKVLVPEQGLAHVIFQNLDLSQFGPDGGRIPNMEFEIVTEAQWLKQLRHEGAAFRREVARLTNFVPGGVRRVWMDERLIYQKAQA